MNKILEAWGAVLLAVTIGILSLISFYFSTPILILPFTATLFTVYLVRESRFAQMKNVFWGHIMVRICTHVFFDLIQ